MTGLQNSRDPARADYDTREFARAIRRKIGEGGKGIRTIAAEIGVTINDISRAAGGQNVSVAKVIALCRWLGAPVEKFYLEPDFSMKSGCSTLGNVKHAPDIGASKAADR